MINIKKTSEHLSWADLQRQVKPNDERSAVIVFSNDSFEKDYPLESRSYFISLSGKSNPWFATEAKISKRLSGYSLDGRDWGIRLDWYLPEWKVEYCYFCEEID